MFQHLKGHRQAAILV